MKVFGGDCASAHEMTEPIMRRCNKAVRLKIMFVSFLRLQFALSFAGVGYESDLTDRSDSFH